jgi:hypothetical protein
LILIAVTFLAMSMAGCTENERAKNYGGEMTIELPCDTKFINATWKESDLWYLSREMRADEVPESYIFHADSAWGVWEGTVKFTESFCGF